MYETFFGLHRRPFSSTPQPECFVASKSIQEQLDSLIVNVERGEGIAVVTGASGLGKTSLCQQLAQELNQSFEAVFLALADFSSKKAFLQSVLFELDHPYIRMEEQELRLELTSYVKRIRPQKRGLLVIVDEAQQLATEVFQEIRSLANLSEDGESLIRFVLCGDLELDEKLAEPDLDSFNQRIRCQISLDPLTRQESAAYIQERLAQAGGDPRQVLTDKALELIAHVSDGNASCLNQLCDHSLLLAFAAQQAPVGEDLVRDALDDLKQLPLHWNDLPADIPVSANETHELENEPPSDHNPTEGQTSVWESGSEQHIDSETTVLEVGEENHAPLQEDDFVETPVEAHVLETTNRDASGETSLEEVELVESYEIEVGSIDSETAIDGTIESSETVDEISQQHELERQSAQDDPVPSQADLFVEEPVLDHYASLDARQQAAQNSGIVWDIATPQAEPTEFESPIAEQAVEDHAETLTDDASHQLDEEFEAVDDGPIYSSEELAASERQMAPFVPDTPIQWEEEQVKDAVPPPVQAAGNSSDDQVISAQAESELSEYGFPIPQAPDIRPDRQIEELLPMIDMAMSNESLPEDEEIDKAFSNVVGRILSEHRPRRPEGDFEYSASEFDSQEDQIGADVLDACLETQQLLSEQLNATESHDSTELPEAMTHSDDVSAQSHFDEEDDDEFVETFDVIEPEATIVDGSSHEDTSGHSEKQSESHDSNSSKRPYGNLFTELRRRQRERSRRKS